MEPERNASPVRIAAPPEDAAEEDSGPDWISEDETEDTPEEQDSDEDQDDEDEPRRSKKGNGRTKPSGNLPWPRRSAPRGTLCYLRRWKSAKGFRRWKGYLPRRLNRSRSTPISMLMMNSCAGRAQILHSLWHFEKIELMNIGDHPQVKELKEKMEEGDGMETEQIVEEMERISEELKDEMKERALALERRTRKPLRKDEELLMELYGPDEYQQL